MKKRTKKKTARSTKLIPYWTPEVVVLYPIGEPPVLLIEGKRVSVHNWDLEKYRDRPSTLTLTVEWPVTTVRVLFGGKCDVERDGVVRLAKLRAEWKRAAGEVNT